MPPRRKKHKTLAELYRNTSPRKGIRSLSTHPRADGKLGGGFLVRSTFLETSSDLF